MRKLLLVDVVFLHFTWRKHKNIHRDIYLKSACLGFTCEDYLSGSMWGDHSLLVDVVFLHFSQKRSKNMHRNINIKDNNMEKLFFLFMACKSCCNVISPSFSFFCTS